jgi:hypothetical protein
MAGRTARDGAARIDQQQFLFAGCSDDIDFQRGEIYTTWVEDHFGDWQPPRCDPPLEVLAAAALMQVDSAGNGLPARAGGHDPFSPWLSGETFVWAGSYS